MDVFIAVVYVVAGVAILFWIGRAVWRHKWKILTVIAVVLLVRNDELLATGLMKTAAILAIPALIIWLLEGEAIAVWFGRRKASYREWRSNHSLSSFVSWLWGHRPSLPSRPVRPARRPAAPSVRRSRRTP